MAEEDLVSLLRRTKDLFSVILIYAPDEFPSEFPSFDKRFAELVDGVTKAHLRLRGKEKQQWLSLCLKELAQTELLYKSGNDHQAALLLQLAEEHYDNALSGKKVKAAFAVAPDGRTEQIE
jgi:hypothetical protein